MMMLFLVAHVAGSGIAIDCSDIDSVVDIGTVVDVPLSGAEVCGLAALRSRVVTVIDTRAALGLGCSPRRGGRAIITRVEGHHYAALVDTLEDVSTMIAQPVPPGLALNHGWRAVATGLVERDGEPLLVIDLPRLVAGAAASASALAA